LDSRVFRLIVQAAAAAGVDFREVDQHNDRWYRRLTWLVQELERQDEIEQWESRLRRIAAVAPTVKEEGRSKLVEMTLLIGNVLDGLYRPDQKQLSEKESKRQRSLADKDAWQSQFGDLNDPAVAARVEHFVANMELLMDRTAKQAAMAAPFGRHMKQDKEVAMMRGPARDA
jgi:hypothetical protein